MDAYIKTWVWRVEFARWTSPESSALTVNVLALSPAEASEVAQEAAREQWRNDAKGLEVLRVVRIVPIHGPTPGAAPKRRCRYCLHFTAFGCNVGGLNINQSCIDWDAKEEHAALPSPDLVLDDCRDAEGSTTVVPRDKGDQ